MDEINALDLKAFATNATCGVFDTMLSMAIDFCDDQAQSVIEGEKIVGSVSFAGDIMGIVSIHVKDNFARLMTASMLGMALEEIEGQEEIEDVIGELSNMIGGDLKSRFCDSGLPCRLSIPSITSGSDFKIESVGWLRHERYPFRHQGFEAMVEVFVKPGKHD